MYLNRLKIASLRAFYNTMICVAAFIYFFDLLGLVGTLRHISETNVVLAICIIVIPLLCIATAIVIFTCRSKSRIYRAEKYNRILEEDNDGFIPYEALSSLTGLSLSTVRNDVRFMTERKIFRNVTYDRKGISVIMKVDTSAEFISVQCPTCGAEVRMRINGGARCSHCGTYLRSEA